MEFVTLIASFGTNHPGCRLCRALSSIIGGLRMMETWGGVRMQAGKRVCGLEQARHGMLSCFDEKTCRFILFLQYYLGFGLLAKRIVLYIWHRGHDKKKRELGLAALLDKQLRS